MSLRTVLAVVLICAISSPLAAHELNTGFVVMNVTANASAATINVTINDTGAQPGCTYYVITRGSYPGGGATVAFFPRQAGTTNVLNATDTDVQPDQLYWYELQVSAFPVPIPVPGCDQTQFRLAHGSSWGLELAVPAYTGTVPAPLYKGLLVADGGFPGAHMELCNGGQAYFSEFHALPSGWEQYVGEIVTAHIDWCCWSVQFGWVFYAAGFAPATCAPIATENITWGHVKSLYR